MSSNAYVPHILVINSSPDILELKREIFEDEGFRVTTKGVLDNEFQDLKQINPDLIVIHYRPRKESDQLQHLIENHHTWRLPVMLCTGAIREVEPIRPKLESMGVKVVYQPFDIDDIVRVAREALGLPTNMEGSVPPQAH